MKAELQINHAYYQLKATFQPIYETIVRAHDVYVYENVILLYVRNYIEHNIIAVFVVL